MKKSNNESPDAVLLRVRDLLQDDTKETKNKIFQMTYNAIAFRRKAQWEPSYETLLKYHLQIGVESLVSCEETLKQYRNKYQQTKIESLRDVLLYYIQLAEKQAEKEIHLLANSIRKENGEAPIQIDLTVDIDETLATTNALLVSTDETQYQSKPLSFLWEVYRSVFVVLRNNGKLNHIYSSTVARAIIFCSRLRRTKEFKTLCDTVRKRLPYVERKQSFDHALKLRDDKTITQLLCTRLALLNGALVMGMHQEAYKIIMRDINDSVLKLAATQRITPSPLLYAQYYLTIAKVFWICERHLLHACSIYKAYVQLNKQSGKGKKKKSKIELPDWLETRHGVSFVEVVLSTLIVPETRNKTDIGLNEEMSTFRLALTFAFPPQPSRSGLLQRIANSPLLTGKLRELYDTLETGFEPMTVCQRVDGLLNDIEVEYLRSWTADEPTIDFSKYKKRIVKHAIVRTMSQLSLCYKSIPWSRVKEICGVFLTPIEGNGAPDEDLKDEEKQILLDREAYLDEFELEDVIVGAVEGGILSLRVDHRSGHMFFHDMDMESGLITNHMVSLATQLNAITRDLDAQDEQRKDINAEQRQNIFALIETGAEEEMDHLPARLDEVEIARSKIDAHNTKVRAQEIAKEEEKQKKETDEKERQHHKQQQLRVDNEKKRKKDEEEKKRVAMAAQRVEKEIKKNVMPDPAKATAKGPKVAKGGGSSWASLAGSGTSAAAMVGRNVPGRSAPGTKTKQKQKKTAGPQAGNRKSVASATTSGVNDGDPDASEVAELRAKMQDELYKARKGKNVAVEGLKQLHQQLKQAEQRQLLEDRKYMRQEFDYWVRACRAAEQPKVAEFITTEQDKKKRLMKLQYKSEKKTAQQQHQKRLQQKDRLLNLILPNAVSFLREFEREEGRRAEERKQRDDDDRQKKLEDERQQRMKAQEDAEAAESAEPTPEMKRKEALKQKQARMEARQKRILEQRQGDQSGRPAPRRRQDDGPPPSRGGLFGVRSGGGGQEDDRPLRSGGGGGGGGGAKTLSQRTGSSGFGSRRRGYGSASMGEDGPSSSGRPGGFRSSRLPARAKEGDAVPARSVRPGGAPGASDGPLSGGPRRFVNSRAGQQKGGGSGGNSDSSRGRQRPRPEVDDDGFTTVVNKKRRNKRSPS